MIIDMHCHIVPENFPPAAGRDGANRWPSMDHFEPGRAKVIIGGENYRTVHAGNWDTDRRLQDMADHGVDAQAISPMPELLSYWLTPRDALDLARHTNEVIRTMCDAAPDRFFGLATVPLQDPHLAAEELTNIKAMGLTGIELGSNVNGRSLGMPEYLEFFQEAQRLDIPIFVHALHPTMLDRLTSASQANPIGFPIDTALTIASLIDGGTAEQCPDLRLAFSHGGGTFPFQLPRYHHQWSGAWNEGDPIEGRGVSLPRSPFDYARRFYYDTLLFDRRAIRYLIDTIGHRQIMVGTDYPFMEPERPADASLRSLDLPDAIHDDITWNNTFRFLGVEAPVPA